VRVELADCTERHVEDLVKRDSGQDKTYSVGIITDFQDNNFYKDHRLLTARR
jgi:hypothetical protein